MAMFRCGQMQEYKNKELMFYGGYSSPTSGTTGTIEKTYTCEKRGVACVSFGAGGEYPDGSFSVAVNGIEQETQLNSFNPRFSYGCAIFPCKKGDVIKATLNCNVKGTNWHGYALTGDFIY